MTQTQPARVRLAELQQSIPKLPQLSPVFSSKNICKFLTNLMQGETLWVQAHATMQSEVVVYARLEDAYNPVLAALLGVYRTSDNADLAAPDWLG